jgi:hypothetical protein
MWKDQSVFQQPKQKAQPKQEESKASTPKETPITDEKPKKPIFEEPEEEFTAKGMVSEMMGGKEQSNFEDAEIDESMPEFGNSQILSELSKLSEEGKNIKVSPVKPIKGRGRPKKK